MPNSAAAISLPLMRDVGKIFDFAQREKNEEKYRSPGFLFHKIRDHTSLFSARNWEGEMPTHFLNIREKVHMSS